MVSAFAHITPHGRYFEATGFQQIAPSVHASHARPHVHAYGYANCTALRVNFCRVQRFYQFSENFNAFGIHLTLFLVIFFNDPSVPFLGFVKGMRQAIDPG